MGFVTLRRIAATATLICVVGSAGTARAGIISVTSSSPSQSVALAYSGTISFDGSPFLGSTITDSVTQPGLSSLAFTYTGVDFATGLRPVIDFTNNTGSALTSLSFSLTGGTLFGFYETGTSPTVQSFVSTSQVADSGTILTVPVSLGAGATVAIYLPVNVTTTSGAFSLLVTAGSPAAVPEPSSLALTVVGGLAGLGFWVRKRRKATTA